MTTTDEGAVESESSVHSRRNVGTGRDLSRHDSQGAERSGRARPQMRTDASDRFDSRSATSPAHEATPLIFRDFADQNPAVSPARRRGVVSEASFPPPSIRRRHVSSTHPSPSPGPSQSWASFLDPSRRSVAIASVSGRDPDTASRKFSLAGPAPMESFIANQPYVDPGYAQLNPAYDQPTNIRPVWGLAKPLPHVLRPGMVPAKDELKEELQQHREDHHETNASVDLESGRVEPTLWPDRIASQLDTIRRGREVQLFESYQRQQKASPILSPLGRMRTASDTLTEVPDMQTTIGETIVEENEDDRSPHREHGWASDPDVAHLGEAIANVNRTKEMEDLVIPYQDAIPLLAYEAEDDEIHNLHTYWSVIRLRLREPLAELLAITVQYTLGFSANLSLTVSRGAAGVGDTGSWAWGLATMIAIYIAGGISGAHLNPAISIMLYIYRGFPLSKIPSYIGAQMLGAFLATLITFYLFLPGLNALEAGQNLVTAGQLSSNTIHPRALPQASTVLANFLTFPRTIWVDTTTAFLTELIGTTILTVSVLALGDDTNAPPGAGMNAFIIGLVVAVLGMAFGYNTGLAMNPARDFGPRVALSLLGYGRRQSSPSLFADGYWFRVAWLGPLAGAVLGGFLYDSMIFVGGESPVNYPTQRIKRAGRKWKNRWRARFVWTRGKVQDMKAAALT